MAYFLSGLALLFIGLKLTGNIAWSWWIVTLPLWGASAFAVLVVGLCALIAVIAASFSDD